MVKKSLTLDTPRGSSKRPKHRPAPAVDPKVTDLPEMPTKPHERNKSDTTVGAVVGLTADGLVGWALDRAEMGRPVRVIVTTEDGHPLGAAVAERFDLPQVANVAGPNVPGFVVPFSSIPTGPWPLRVRLRDSEGHFLGEVFEILEAHFLASQPVAQADLEGMIDGIINGRLSGWVFCPTDPKRRHTVELLNGDERVARVIASSFRADVAAANKSDGECGFDFPLPISLLDGKMHFLSVRVTGTPYLVPGGPVAFGPMATTFLLREFARLQQEFDRIQSVLPDSDAKMLQMQSRVLSDLSRRMMAFMEIDREFFEREIANLRADLEDLRRGSRGE